jgi:hypothetical protein
MTDPTAMSGTNNALDVLALGPTPSAAQTGRGEGRGGGVSGGTGGSNNWFQALATAWGQSLDQEAQRIETMSDGIGGGNEEPSQIAQLSAESLRMQFISQSENTSIDAVGQSLQTMARKD